MNFQKVKDQKFSRRKVRTRAKLYGTLERPRLSVSRSLRGISAQLIDDAKGVTLVSATLKELGDGAADKKLEIDGKVIERTKEQQAYRVGKLLAERAGAKKINQVVFDRGGRAYAGRVRALAEGARAGGLNI